MEVSVKKSGLFSRYQSLTEREAQNCTGFCRQCQFSDTTQTTLGVEKCLPPVAGTIQGAMYEPSVAILRSDQWQLFISEALSINRN